jgi:hypothetical protein
MTREQPELSLRAELAWLRARYDYGQVSPALYSVIQRLEAELAWKQHRAGGRYDRAATA